MFVRRGGWWVLLGMILVGCGGGARPDGSDGSDDGGGSRLTTGTNGRGYRAADGVTDLARVGYVGGGDALDAPATDGGVDVIADVTDGGGGTGGAPGLDGGAGDVADSGDDPSETSMEVFPEAAGSIDAPTVEAAGPDDAPTTSDAADEALSTDTADAGTESGAADAPAELAVDSVDGVDGIDSVNTGEAAPDLGQADGPADAAPPPPPGPSSVAITWASIANVHLELGATSVLIDGYITRLPGNDFYGGGSGLAFTHTNYSSDETAIRRVLGALGGAGRINWLFTGHSHWDHSFDTATWARLTGAPIYGPTTTCLQARAEATPAAGCTALGGGEKLSLAPGVTVRVVRWNHSGDSTNNPEQHNPVELKAVPTPDAQGRLRAGVSEDFPNGGGSRAFLFTFDSPAGLYSVFFEDSTSAVDLKQPIIIDNVNYGAPLSNLAAALAEAALTHVDLWIATGGAPVAQLVVPLIKPKAYLPVHWDGLFRAFQAGAPVFADSDLTSYLKGQGVKLVTPIQYLDKWSLSPSGLVAVDNKQIQHALGF